jgi:uncharacterized membrane-anchored protein YhcB (DUF1043 family)
MKESKKGFLETFSIYFFVVLGALMITFIVILLIRMASLRKDDQNLQLKELEILKERLDYSQQLIEELHLQAIERDSVLYVEQRKLYEYLDTLAQQRNLSKTTLTNIHKMIRNERIERNRLQDRFIDATLPLPK